MLQRSSQPSMFAQAKYVKLGEKDGYFLYHDAARNKLYLTDNESNQKLTNIVATANYSETKEAEIALLSNIQANAKDKEIVFDLVKKHLAQNRADLFYSEADMDLSAARGSEKCLHENSVMVRPPLGQTKKVHFLPKGFVVIDNKNELLSMLPQMTSYLLKHSNWAKINGLAWLTEELLAKRIMESSKTCLIMGPNNRPLA